jgi:hypothetical protein
MNFIRYSEDLMNWAAEVWFPAGGWDFLYSTASRPALEPHPALYLMGTEGPSPGGKGAEREGDQ